MTSAKRGEGGVSQKLTKVDKEGGRGFCQKLMSANYNISLTKIMTICSLEALFALFERTPKLTKNGHFISYWTKLYFFQFSFVILNLLAKRYVTIWPKLLFSFVAQNIHFHKPVLKSWCQPGGGGGYFFVKKLTEADKWGGRGQNWPNFGWRHLWTIPYFKVF